MSKLAVAVANATNEWIVNKQSPSITPPKDQPFNEVNTMKKLTIKILMVLTLVAGAMAGSMILTGVSGQPTAQAGFGMEC